MFPILRFSTSLYTKEVVNRLYKFFFILKQNSVVTNTKEETAGKKIIAYICHIVNMTTVAKLQYDICIK